MPRDPGLDPATSHAGARPNRSGLPCSSRLSPQCNRLGTVHHGPQGHTPYLAVSECKVMTSSLPVTYDPRSRSCGSRPPGFDKHLEHGFHVEEIMMFLAIDRRCWQGLDPRSSASPPRATYPRRASARPVRAQASSGRDVPARLSEPILPTTTAAQIDRGRDRRAVSRCASPRIPPSCRRPPHARMTSARAAALE
jgi:hypothetical protein